MSIPTYPILYDWIAVVVLSIAFLVFTSKYGSKHPSFFSFIVGMLMILPWYISWENIFLDVMSGSIPTTMDQIYMLAPLVGCAGAVIANVYLNWPSHNGKGETKEEQNK